MDSNDVSQKIGPYSPEAWKKRIKRYFTKTQLKRIKEGKTVAMCFNGVWVELLQRDPADVRLAKLNQQLNRIQAEIRRLS